MKLNQEEVFYCFKSGKYLGAVMDSSLYFPDWLTPPEANINGLFKVTIKIEEVERREGKLRAYIPDPEDRVDTTANTNADA